MTKLKTEIYAIIRHPAATHDPKFNRGVEEYQLMTEHEVQSILALGGLLFTTWDKASTYCYEENYPEGYVGLIPRASGKFRKLKPSGLKVYTPNKGGRTINGEDQ